MKTSLLTLTGAVLICQAASGALYTETFPYPGGSGDMAISTAGWLQDLDGSGNLGRIYDNGGGDGAVYSYNGANTVEAFYANTPSDGFPSIDPTINPGLFFSVDLFTGYNGENVMAYVAAEVGGSWYASASALTPPPDNADTVVTSTLGFDPTASQWVELTLGDGTGSDTPVLGATPGADLSGDITGAGMVFVHTAGGDGTNNFDNFTVAVPEPSISMLIGIAALGFAARRRV